MPELRLHLASEVHELWHSTEEQLAEKGLPPPFWAFAWAGGQGLARYILDNPEIVAGKSVLDFASGSGLVAIAACKAGAKSVTGCDIDPFAEIAAFLNAQLNQIAFDFRLDDLVGRDEGWDVLLAGDVFYDRAMADHISPWLSDLATRGAKVYCGDPGRYYLPKDRMSALATYTIPVSRVLEDSEIKKTTVWRFNA
ncbi:50S ribosomal protein L11 methyltransferase [Limoniibacter endophyticus]|uniref:50S ribosomal protein L11 methyltransferase n=1 Tax=Limoniibacter endophyticus TaxID=1565040 RepID=A0A8J3GHS9_9HYPH|nr:50S ribosomal protein L11 methyltransferase [Limoniibacter endophyticus]